MPGHAMPVCPYLMDRAKYKGPTYEAQAHVRGHTLCLLRQEICNFSHLFLVLNKDDKDTIIHHLSTYHGEINIFLYGIPML